MKDDLAMARTIQIPTHRAPTSVGEVLEKEFRKELGLTQDQIATALGIDRVRYSAIVNGRRRLSVDTAQRLARVLGTSIEFWMNVQHATDVYEATKKPLLPEITNLKKLSYTAPRLQDEPAIELAYAKTRRLPEPRPIAASSRKRS